jgi:hypothetical protein
MSDPRPGLAGPALSGNVRTKDAIEAQISSGLKLPAAPPLLPRTGYRKVLVIVTTLIPIRKSAFSLTPLGNAK